MMHQKPAKLIIFTGAGLSVESGLSTYRCKDGIWQNYDINKVCNYLTWKNNKELVFEFYQKALDNDLQAQPNAAHKMIASWQQKWPDRTVVYTQNVDSLLERAGCAEVIHLHGRLCDLKCGHCSHVWEAKLIMDTPCPKCQSYKTTKPGVVFFNEPAPLYHQLSREVALQKPSDIIVCIGSAFEVLAPEAVINARFMGSERVIDIDPGIKDDEIRAFFGQHIQLPASEGVKKIEPEIERWMDGF